MRGTETFGRFTIVCVTTPSAPSSDVRESARLDGVLVAVERASGRMVATVRVFARLLQAGGAAPREVGGIGEVSTLPAFRKLGLRVIFSGPYSYTAAPIERWFSSLKTGDLNPAAVQVGKR